MHQTCAVLCCVVWFCWKKKALWTVVIFCWQKVVFCQIVCVFLRAWYHFVKNENEPTRTTFKSHKNTVTSRFQQHNRTFLHLFWSVFLRDNVSCISVTFHVHYFLTGYNIVRFYVQVFWCILLLFHLHSNLALIFFNVGECFL